MSFAKRRWTLAAAGALLAAVSFGASVASAHVTVWPRESAPGAFERYTVRVPSERPSPTVRVELDIPEQVTFSRVMPKPGWRYELARNAAGRVTGITWLGGSIGPEEFDEFAFQARNGQQTGKVAWRARQVYADGTTVAWEGPEGSDAPASVTELMATGSGDLSHGGGSAVAQGPAGPTVTAEPTSTSMQSADNGGFALALAGAAFLVGALSLVLSVAALRRAP